MKLLIATLFAFSLFAQAPKPVAEKESSKPLSRADMLEIQTIMLQEKDEADLIQKYGPVLSDALVKELKTKLGELEMLRRSQFTTRVCGEAGIPLDVCKVDADNATVLKKDPAKEAKEPPKR